MKKIFSISIVIVAAALLTLVSCQKENLENSNSAERIISGAFNSEATKTTLYSDGITPLWSVGDKIRVLGNSSYQDVTLVPNGSTPGTNEGVISSDGESFTFSTTLEGTLYAVYPASATTLTSCSDGNITFTVPSIQDGTFGSANICVASEGGENCIYFTNAAAVVEMIVATGVVGTKFAATNNIAGNMIASMGTGGTISGTTTTSLSSSTISVSDTKAPAGSKFYLAVAPVESGAVTITCNTISKSGTKNKTTKTLAKDRIYGMDLSDMTFDTDFDLTGQHGVLNGQEYVIIKAKYDGTNDSYLKWATQNLAVTASGKAKWRGTEFIIGDYFQWGASYAGYGITTAAFKNPDNLVLYDSFTNTFAGGSSDAFVLKSGESFDKTNAPFGGASYSRYTTAKSTLALTDDVANIVLGGSWRLPTGEYGQFHRMGLATYWAWDDTDKGYYVFKPGVGTSGAAASSSAITGTDDKTKALLFFPATGICETTGIKSMGNFGMYWSNTVDNLYIHSAYTLLLLNDHISIEQYEERFKGYPIRPVAD